jgi:hypothetical protein
MMKKI